MHNWIKKAALLFVAAMVGLGLALLGMACDGDEKGEGGATATPATGKIAFVSAGYSDPSAFYVPESREISVMNADGAGRTRLTDQTRFTGAPSHEAYADPTWPPDGSRIAFHSVSEPWDIYVMSADGSGLFNRTNDCAHDGPPPGRPTAPGSRSAPTATATTRST